MCGFIKVLEFDKGQGKSALWLSLSTPYQHMFSLLYYQGRIPSLPLEIPWYFFPNSVPFSRYF